jgi:hypothetical protein
MATLKSKGKIEIGRIEYTAKTLAFFDNGDILVNYGFGWKKYATVKPGINPNQAYMLRKNFQIETLETHPALKAYRARLIDIGGLRRSKLHTAIQFMPDDPDGVWSETCDSYGDNFSASLDEVVNLCRLYKNCAAEAEMIKSFIPE